MHLQWNTYSAMRKKKILPFATMWIELEVIMLPEMSQTETNTVCHFLHMESKKN